ncbi:MAG: putative lipid II flippase FtsW [Eubacteriales bacterium]|nr:putative lipid II flippase FtsW [Eubacteriales bacterium]
MNSNRRTQPKSRRPKTLTKEKKPRTKVRKLPVKLGEIDFTFLFLIIVLLAFGLVMLLSASTPSANTKIGDSYYFFVRQLCGVGVGAIGMIFFAMVDYHKYKKYVNWAFWIGIVLLICCRVPVIGQMRNGAWRWLKTPFIQLQPSEFMKPLIVMFFAKLISEKKYRLDNLPGLGVYAAVLVIIAGIMWLWQKHLSGAIVICAMGVVVMLLAGAKLRYFIIAACAAVPVGAMLLLQDPTRWGRVLSFIDPFRDTGDKSYQITQSLIAIGTGGLFGKGLGQSVQKYGFLPEPYNDFIFAIVCEELGFIGAIIVIALFVALVARGIKIAMEAPDIYGSLVTMGIVSHIAIQSLFNIAVVSCSIPTTGMSLPFFSYGGTAIMVLVAEMGIVLNVSRQSTKTKTLPK